MSKSTIIASLHIDSVEDVQLNCKKVWAGIPEDNTYALHIDNLTIFINPEQIARLRAVCGDALIQIEQNKMFELENVG